MTRLDRGCSRIPKRTPEGLEGCFHRAKRADWHARLHTWLVGRIVRPVSVILVDQSEIHSVGIFHPGDSRLPDVGVNANGKHNRHGYLTQSTSPVSARMNVHESAWLSAT